MALNKLWDTWNANGEIILKGTPYTMIGFSIAALRTHFFIKPLSICLDAGLSCPMSPDFIFGTHCHSDHMASIPYNLITPKTNVKVYVPIESMEPIRAYIRSAFLMSLNITDPTAKLDVDDIYELVGVKDGDVLNLEIKGKQFEITVISMDHSVPCVGFCFTECKQKLKKEYLGLSGKEIKALKDSNTVITETVRDYQFCYLGDTSKKILENDFIYKFRNIMIECTFLLDDELDNADKTKHMHWDHLKPYVIAHPDNTFYLYHFSQRYKKDEIIDFFKSIDLKNIVVLSN